MTLSEQMVEDWHWHSVYCAGRLLPMNYLDFDDAGTGIYMGHMIPIGEPAITPPMSSSPVRLIALHYEIASILATDKS
jgi:hypothetical protein